jgi:hypothetical protein
VENCTGGAYFSEVWEKIEIQFCASTFPRNFHVRIFELGSGSVENQDNLQMLASFFFCFQANFNAQKIRYERNKKCNEVYCREIFFRLYWKKLVLSEEKKSEIKKNIFLHLQK